MGRESEGLVVWLIKGGGGAGKKKIRVSGFEFQSTMFQTSFFSSSSPFTSRSDGTATIQKESRFRNQNN